jgi:transposase-like protein
MVLYVLVQSRRNRRAAKRLLRKLLKRQCRAPRVMTTGKLFHLRRDHVTASENRAVRARASEVWADISGVAAAA